MNKLIAIILLTVISAFSSGNIGAQNGMCPRGDGWKVSSFPSDTDTVGISFAITSVTGPIDKICINGIIFETDSTKGNFTVTGLGTTELWITSGEQITEIGKFFASSLTATPTASATSMMTATPTATTISMMTATPIATTISAMTATPIVKPINESLPTKSIFLFVGILLAIVAVMVALLARRRKR